MKFKATLEQDIEELEKKRTDRTITLSDNIDPDANVYKEGMTFWVNKELFKILSQPEWKSKRSRLVDRELSRYFGITYAQAYGRKATRQKGQERLWDVEGKYKKLIKKNKKEVDNARS